MSLLYVNLLGFISRYFKQNAIINNFKTPGIILCPFSLKPLTKSHILNFHIFVFRVVPYSWFICISLQAYIFLCTLFYLFPLFQECKQGIEQSTGVMFTLSSPSLLILLCSADNLSKNLVCIWATYNSIHRIKNK